MKNRNFIKNSILVLLPISLGLGVLLGVNNSDDQPVSASSYSVNSVPSNLNLNDLSDSAIRSYYADLNILTTSERQGTNLLKHLKPILKNGQKYYSYGSSATTAVWQAYEIVDRDWVKSPASGISGYNSSDNTISGYTYGTSNKSVGSNPYIHALYVNRTVENQTRAWGNHEQDQWGINQEHIWAKSCGFNDKSPGAGARGDLMHLWAGNGRVNGTNHSNYYYGYVDKTKTYDDAKTYATTLSGNLTGLSKTLGGTYKVFEPQDCDKGDIARAIFYMAARYNYLSGSDSDGIDAGNPNLEIVNTLNWGPGTSYTSSTTNKGQMGILQDLLEWNRLDPPDSWEIHRNNLLYRNFTKNRNPFIDFPEWAEYIWGKSTDGSYSSTVTGYATPSADNINTFKTGGTPTVSNVSVSPSEVSLNLSGISSADLSATVSGTNNPSQSVTWSSSNTNVATVNSNGVVTAVATGNAVITATSVADSTKSGTCSVTVTNSVVSVTGVSLNKNSTTINVGSSEVLSEEVSPTNASNKGVTWSSSNSNIVSVTDGVIRGEAAGEATITVRTNDGGYTASCTVTVTESGSGESTTSSTTISDYASDHSWSNAVKYSTISIDSNATASVGTGSANTGKYYTTGNEWRFYQTEGATLVISVPDTYTLDSVTLTFNVANTGQLTGPGGSVVTSGQAFALSGSSATFIVGNSGSATNGQIKFTSISVTYHVSSAASKELVSISLDTSAVQTDFYVNDPFDYTGLVVTAYYDDESDDVVNGYTVSSPDMSSAGQKPVTVTYGEESETYTINVLNNTLSSIAVSGQKTSYTVGDSFEEPTVTATFASGATSDVTEDATFTGYDLSTAGDQTVTVSYTFEGITKTDSYQITVNEEVIESGSANNPYTVAEARAAITAAGGSTVNDKYTRGIIYQIDSYNSTYKSITYWISDDGTSSNPLEVYSGKGLDGADFTASTDLSVGDIVVVKGNLKKFNSIFEYNYDNQLVSIDKPSTTNQYSLITNPSELLTGDEIIFRGVRNTTNYYSMSSFDENNKYMTTTMLSMSDGYLIKNDSTMCFMVIKTDRGYRFKNSSNKYLAWSSSLNYTALESENNLTDKSLFNLTYSNNNMSVKGINDGGLDYPRNDLRFNNSSGSLRFTFYQTETATKPYTSIFKKRTQILADEWSSEFMTRTYNCNRTHWSLMEKKFNFLESCVQSELVSCVAMDDSKYSVRSQAMARYEYILSHYQGVNHFISERSVSLAKPGISALIFGKNSSSVALIIVISLISVSSVGGYLFMRSRKKEEF